MKHDQIEMLVNKLLSYGYHQYQIKQMISDAIEKGPADDDGVQEQLIIEVLEGYVEFGAKCKTNEKA
ncbi:hypothetical protein [Sporomusa acidovorans]|uniref:Uncharacterized protein n=1 Tax=Sporomusa acidovorans (strain ATCC 49682 / DSM 3132 / Mol) TaxID=1123286 RepID=A0ABZ3IY39_SPOA4|nr:hypothetical protein [Sporomusa acidovorans]OZC17670.1 hypothetical protein SPACI_36740 [Sporomusa acidovorans DSM 3132]SDE11611.1 hypothetical protein SAMN04488499_100849 [Sporomusa acidovorans]